MQWCNTTAKISQKLDLMSFVDSDFTKTPQKLDFCEFHNSHMKNMCEITNIHETNLGNDLKIKSK